MLRFLNGGSDYSASHPVVTGHSLRLKPGRGVCLQHWAHQTDSSPALLFSCPILVSEHSWSNRRLHFCELFVQLHVYFKQLFPKCPATMYKVESRKRDSSRESEK